MQDFLMSKHSASKMNRVLLPITTSVLILGQNANRVALSIQLGPVAAVVCISNVPITATDQGMLIQSLDWRLQFDLRSAPGFLKGPIYAYASAATTIAVLEDVYAGPGHDLMSLSFKE
jgi:hypothetical protein